MLGTMKNGGGAAEPLLAAMCARYEESPEYLLGAELIDAVTGELGCSAEEAYMMLRESKRAGGFEAISARAAKELACCSANGGFDADGAVGDGDFIAMLCEMPVSAAIRLYSAELAAREAKEKLTLAQENAKSDVLEKLRAFRALPEHGRTAPTAALSMDFRNMTSEEFAALKERLRLEANARL